MTGGRNEQRDFPPRDRWRPCPAIGIAVHLLAIGRRVIGVEIKSASLIGPLAKSIVSQENGPRLRQPIFSRRRWHEKRLPGVLTVAIAGRIALGLEIQTASGFIAESETERCHAPFDAGRESCKRRRR